MKLSGGVLASTWYVDFKAHVELCTCARKTKVQTRRAEAGNAAANGLANAVTAVGALLMSAVAFFRREEAFA